MKRCPSCQRTYMDDAQSFCANDGTPLVEENAPPSDLQKTMLASGPPSYTPPEQGSWPPPPPGGQTPPGMGGQQPGWGQTPPPNPYGQQPYGGQQQYGRQQQYGQPPYGQPGQQQWGGGYIPPAGAAGAYAAETGGQRKGLSIAALILGILSTLGAILFLTGIVRRYHYVSDYRFRTDEFMLGSLIASVLGGLAVILGIIALIFAISKAARWAGKGPAAAAIILGLFGAITSLTLNATSSSIYLGSSNSNSNSNRSRTSSNSNNSNGSTTYSNRNGSTTASNSNSSNSNSSSSSSMTEDEKYRIFYAAGKTNDRALQTEIAQLIGIIDADGQPTSYYQTFVGGAGAWALRDSSFPRTVATPEAARAYVMAHR